MFENYSQDFARHVVSEDSLIWLYVEISDDIWCCTKKVKNICEKHKASVFAFEWQKNTFLWPPVLVSQAKNFPIIDSLPPPLPLSNPKLYIQIVS